MHRTLTAAGHARTGHAAEAIGPRRRHVGRALARMIHAVAERRRIAREAVQLHAMSDRDLRDIGLTRGDIGDAVRGQLPTPRR